MQDVFHRIAAAASRWAGSPWAFGTAVLLVIGWGASGPMLGYSDSWHLLLNSPTTAITFLMVFLIQHTQNRDSKAIHLKLDELIRVSSARNAFAALEHATEAELDSFEKEFEALRRHRRSEPPQSP